MRILQRALNWLVKRSDIYLTVVSQRDSLENKLALNEASYLLGVEELHSKLVVAQANLSLATALRDKAEAKFEAACIVNHLQKQKQTAYERHVYACSMGGMILDNQEEIARIVMDAKKAAQKLLEE